MSGIETQRLRQGIRRHMAGSPLSEALLRAELRLLALADRPKPSPLDTSDLTVIIKTFERPRELRRLVASIRSRYRGLRIVVADDSRRPRPVAGVETIQLPYNSGVSAGRRACLEEVRTRFFLTCDDDFLFYRGTDLARAMRTIRRSSRIDILGGSDVTLPEWRQARAGQRYLPPGPTDPILPLGTLIGGLPVVDKPPNFFIGRTESVRQVNWRPELRFVEHADFFRRARGELISVQDDRFRVLHIKSRLGREKDAVRTSNVQEAMAILRQDRPNA